MQEKIESILRSMLFGNWEQAQKDYKELNITASDFSDLMLGLTKEQLQDLALLGFYTRNKD